MRVQRTRSSPSALREPLTRHPLGRPERASGTVLFLALVPLLSCSTNSVPTQQVGITCGARHETLEAVRKLPADVTLGQLTEVFGRPDADLGSGAYVLEWRCTDGSLIHASMTTLDASARPIAMRIP